MRLRFSIFSAVISLAVFFCARTEAQTVTGTISGMVVDSTQAAVPGAAVTLSNEATGEKRSSAADAGGGFIFTAVPPGTYKVAVEAQGFKRLEKRSLTLSASERLTAGTLQLEVGAVSDSVTVSGESAQVQTVSQERSALLDSQQMAGLMTRGRDFLSLMKTLPGVVPSADSNRLGDGGAPQSVQGGRRTQLTMSVDGVTGNDLSSTEAFITPVNMDAIAEVKVQLTNYQAEYGRSGSAVINAITKSGTNQFHGGGYYYLRNEALNANEFFNNKNSVKKPLYRYQNGGWNLGGPVFIPGKFNTGKDKLFFFFSQEFLRSKTPGSLIQNTVPTALQRAGDFSLTLTVAGALQAVNDPLTGKAFPGNVIPQNRIDANGQKLLSIFPQANMLDRTISKGNYNYVFQESLPSPRTQEIFRTDYNPTSKLRMYFRGNVWRNQTTGYGAAAGVSVAGISKSFYGSNSNSGIVSASYTFSPTAVNEVSFGATRWIESGGPLDNAQLTPITRSAVGVSFGQFNPAGNPLNILPTMSFGGVPGAAALSFDQRYPIGGASTIFDFTDGFTKIAGRHMIKAGVFIERDRMYKGYRGTFAGALSFGNDTANSGDTLYAYSNAILGNFQSYSESTSRPFVDMRGFQAEWYVQDNWRLTKKLTLDYGVRFYTYVPMWQANNQASGFVPSLYDPSKAVVLYRPAINPANGNREAQNPVTGAFAPAVYIGAIAPGVGNPANGMILQSAASKGFVDNHGVLPAPRVGFAYDPNGDGKTAIRGGFGIFFNPLIRGGGVGGTSQSFVNNPPILYTSQIYYGNLNALLPANIAALQKAGVIFPASTGLGIDSKGEIPAVYNYSLGVQRDIGFKTVLDVAYVGSLGRHLQMKQNLNTLPYGANFLPQNQDPTAKACSTPGCAHLPTNFYSPYAGYGSITYFVHNTNSSYHSLQVQANRRFAKGLQFGAAFTWSKAMDYGDGADEDTEPLYLTRQWIYGLAGFDRPFNLTFNWSWDIPGGSRLWNSVVTRTALDGWHLSGVASFISGSPSAVSFSTNPSIDIAGGGDFTRVNVVGDPILPKGQRTVDRFFNSSAFAEPAQRTFGNAGKFSFRGPGTNNWDLSIYKSFKVHERASFQFRWEAYNTFNHAQFSAVNTSATFNATGAQINQLFGSLTATSGPRVMQGSLRFTF